MDRGGAALLIAIVSTVVACAQRICAFAKRNDAGAVLYRRRGFLLSLFVSAPVVVVDSAKQQLLQQTANYANLDGALTGWRSVIGLEGGARYGSARSFPFPCSYHRAACAKPLQSIRGVVVCYVPTNRAIRSFCAYSRQEFSSIRPSKYSRARITRIWTER